MAAGMAWVPACLVAAMRARNRDIATRRGLPPPPPKVGKVRIDKDLSPDFGFGRRVNGEWLVGLGEMDLSSGIA